jgi:hypothetical protein
VGKEDSVMINITFTMSSWWSQYVANLCSTPSAESQPESSIVDNPYPKMTTDVTIKSNYFPAGDRFYVTVQTRARNPVVFLYVATLCKKVNYQSFWNCLGNYLRTPNDQVKAGATSGIKVASEAAFKRDGSCKKFEKEI